MAYLALVVEDVVINKWDISEEVMIIGRAVDCDIQIDDQSVSSKHARILVESEPYMESVQSIYLEDLKSTNGTELNGVKIEKEKLKNNDSIKVGFNLFRFINSESPDLNDTAVIIS